MAFFVIHMACATKRLLPSSFFEHKCEMNTQKRFSVLDVIDVLEEDPGNRSDDGMSSDKEEVFGQ